ncbi:nucleolin like 2 [Euphorbia peplus]|nr:nucleolin like 2 [Euphorbia peplus]
MGKSSKKSATKVTDVPAVTPLKSGKKGKREAEDSIEKLVSAKKQKTAPEVKPVVPVKKPEVKTQKKKKVESSSDSGSDDSSSEEEKPKVVTKKAVKPPSSDESSSSESDDSSDEKEKSAAPSKKQPVKNGSAIAPSKKAKAESSSDSSSSDESEDEKPSAKPAAPVKKQVGATNGAVPTKAKAESSSDSDEDDSSDDEAVATAKTVPPVAGNKKAESSDSDEDSDSDESSDESEEEKSQKKQVAAKKESDSDDSSDETSEDEKKTAKTNVKVTASKQASSDESSAEESSEDEDESSDDEKSFKTPKKNGGDVEMVDASKTDDLKSAKKAHQTPVSPQVQSTGSKTLFVGNLSFKVERGDVESFFQEIGEVVDVRFAVDNQDQRFKGFGHVEFATVEEAQKALKLNGNQLLGREVRLDLARERGDKTPYTPNNGPRGYGAEGPKVFIRGFDVNSGEDEIKSSLEEHFKGCGGISKINIPTDRDTGAFKGMAYMEFQDSNGLNKALQLDGSEFGDQYLTVQEARPRDGGSSGGRGRGFGGRDGGRSFGSRDGGRGGRSGRGRDSFGRGDRGRGRFNKPSNMAFSGKKKTFGDD